MEFFNANSFDIFALQEIKMNREQGGFDFGEYRQFWNSAERKGYSGTLVLTKYEPDSAEYGMGIPEHDREGRVITLKYPSFYFVNVYTPNSKHELLRLEYRMEWEDSFRAYLKGLAEKKPVVVCGDLNVAHKEIDLANPKSNVKNAGFTPQEREKLSTLLDAGFVDTFRHLYPDKAGAYTWWSYMAKARARNVGWRIDYFLVSAALKDAVKEAYIYADITGSDHCPVGVEIEIS